MLATLNYCTGTDGQITAASLTPSGPTVGLRTAPTHPPTRVGLEHCHEQHGQHVRCARPADDGSQVPAARHGSSGSSQARG